MKAFLVYVTVANADEADLIARTAVSEKLAACVNMLGSIKSLYRWEDRIQEDTEVAILLKTSAECKTALIERIKTLHSYQCPCIVALPIADGNPDFLQWIQSETKPPADA
ncbi:MAG: divalent-cation tolerance protein CutA [Kiritimatiellales bacterium]|nr:divalent-cation tolerance protein CutA [Kiritimatiellales bacterium]